MKFKAVLFDLDGTLLDTLEGLADSMNSVLSQQGFEGHDYDAYRFFIGDGLTNLVRKTLPPGRRDPETVDRCLALMKKEYRLIWKRKTKPYPGINNMLDDLKKLGLSLAVLSNKDHFFTKEMVERFFPAGIFSELAGAKPGVPLKPDPESARSIMSALALQPQDCLFVGDTSIDMKTAVNAGVFPLGVSWGFRPVQELLNSGAERIIDTPGELLDFLSGPNSKSA